MFSAKKILFTERPSIIEPKIFYFKLNPNRLPPLGTSWPFGERVDYFGEQVFYLDQNFTIPATTPPKGLDTVVISGTGNVEMSWANSAGWSGNLHVRGDIVFMTLSKAINIESAIFYDNTSVQIKFIASSTMVFNNNSTNGAAQEAQLITLNDYAYSGGQLKANVILNGCSQTHGSIIGNVTLNDHSELHASVSGTITNNSDGQCPTANNEGA